MAFVSRFSSWITVQCEQTACTHASSDTVAERTRALRTGECCESASGPADAHGQLRTSVAASASDRATVQQWQLSSSPYRISPRISLSATKYKNASICTPRATPSSHITSRWGHPRENCRFERSNKLIGFPSCRRNRLVFCTAPPQPSWVAAAIASTAAAGRAASSPRSPRPSGRWDPSPGRKWQAAKAAGADRARAASV